MASFDLGSVLGAARALNPVSVTEANVNTTAVDTSGFSSVAFVTAVGTGNTSATVNIVQHYWESNDTNIANGTRLSTNRVILNPLINDSNATFIASVVPTKRYVFAELAPSAAFTTLVSVTAVLKRDTAPA